MANQRKKGKRKLQVWMDDEQRERLANLAKAHGYESVTAFLQDVADGKITTVPATQDQE